MFLFLFMNSTGVLSKVKQYAWQYYKTGFQWWQPAITIPMAIEVSSAFGMSNQLTPISNADKQQNMQMLAMAIFRCRLSLWINSPQLKYTYV